MAYERERTRITAATVARAKRLVAEGAVPGRGLDISDEGTPGLVLRVGPRGARWMLKTEKKTVTLGSVDALTHGQARIAAANARADIARGEDPAEAVEVYRLAVDQVEDPEWTAWGPAPVDRKAARRRDGPWIVEDLIDEFVSWKTPRLHEGYGPKWERYLRLPELDRFAHLPVRDLRIETLEEMRDALVAAHPTSTAWRAARQSSW